MTKRYEWQEYSEYRLLCLQLAYSHKLGGKLPLPETLDYHNNRKAHSLTFWPTPNYNRLAKRHSA